ncbi:MAG: SLBB domain-containing protein, partial [Gemmatimonadota bacterium]|nr:SLBB domain-containing protein [Gemmatimonadota bacterium]
LVQQIRQRMLASNLTPEQIRARLKAEGYPENLLDDYMVGAKSSNVAAPGSNVFAAIRALGITDSTDVDDLERMNDVRTPRRKPARPVLDSAALRDTTLSRASAELFGLSLFRDASTRFQANVDGPVDPDYRLGPGDQLVLILTGDFDRAVNLDVTREGFVVIPDVGQVSVANLTLGQLNDVLYSRLGRVYSGVRRGSDATMHLTVSVSKLRAIQIVVTGDVMTPGAYRVSSAGTAFNALYAAGGPNENGSLRSIEVRRGGKTVATLDVYDYLLHGDASKDVRLQQGDLLFVPVHGPRVRVDGAVTRPATYELKAGETLADAIDDAGGFKATAGARHVLIDRILPAASRSGQGADRVVADVPLGANGKAPAFALAEGDVVRVPEIAERVRNRITLGGNVWAPGTYGFQNGLTLEAALRRAGGVKPDAYLGRVLVSRLRADSTRVQLRAMLRDTTGATVEPFALAEDDEITVFSRTNFRSQQVVVIGGAVRKSGQYPWREGMTMRDLVLLADGLEESAYLGAAEIARLPAQYNGHTTAETIRVPLDSGYLFAQGRNPLAFSAPEVLLQPYDNVLILREPGFRLPTVVMLTGEVRFPGRYTITDRGERISDLIARAGGVTALADQDAAYFTRRLSSNTNRARLDSATAASDSLRLEANAARIRVGVDLAYALKHRGGNDDLVLEGNDSLDIPSRRQTVEVRGEVNAPTALAHANGRSLGFYVDAAGGPSAKGNARRAYVVQPNGKVESRHHLFGFITLDPTPRPGATVVVPAEDPNRNRGNLGATVALIAQLLVSVAAIVAVTKK